MSLSKGRSYNFPIQLWLLDSFPFTPPICHLKPTSNMVIREGKHVDAHGRIHLPGLHNWDHVRSCTVWLKFKIKSGQGAEMLLFRFLCNSQSHLWWVFWMRWLPNFRKTLHCPQRPQQTTKIPMSSWRLSPISVSVMVQLLIYISFIIIDDH